MSASRREEATATKALVQSREALDETRAEARRARAELDELQGTVRREAASTLQQGLRAGMAELTARRHKAELAELNADFGRAEVAIHSEEMLREGRAARRAEERRAQHEQKLAELQRAVEHAEAVRRAAETQWEETKGKLQLANERRDECERTQQRTAERLLAEVERIASLDAAIQAAERSRHEGARELAELEMKKSMRSKERDERVNAARGLIGRAAAQGRAKRRERDQLREEQSAHERSRQRAEASLLEAEQQMRACEEAMAVSRVRVDEAVQVAKLQARAVTREKHAYQLERVRDGFEILLASEHKLAQHRRVVAEHRAARSAARLSLEREERELQALGRARSEYALARERSVDASRQVGQLERQAETLEERLVEAGLLAKNAAIDEQYKRAMQQFIGMGRRVLAQGGVLPDDLLQALDQKEEEWTALRLAEMRVARAARHVQRALRRRRPPPRRPSSRYSRGSSRSSRGSSRSWMVRASSNAGGLSRRSSALSISAAHTAEALVSGRLATPSAADCAAAHPSGDGHEPSDGGRTQHSSTRRESVRALASDLAAADLYRAKDAQSMNERSLGPGALDGGGQGGRRPRIALAAWAFLERARRAASGHRATRTVQVAPGDARDLPADRAHLAEADGRKHAWPLSVSTDAETTEPDKLPTAMSARVVPPRRPGEHRRGYLDRGH